ncbi:MAG: hypothetical protein QNK37_03385 [Acidobacteriota bacterium]|nr:hypothetical protein [Acidobacteriota bacterium]
MESVTIPINEVTRLHKDKVMTLALQIGTKTNFTALGNLIGTSRKTTRRIADAMGLVIDPDTGLLAESCPAKTCCCNGSDTQDARSVPGLRHPDAPIPAHEPGLLPGSRPQKMSIGSDYGSSGARFAPTGLEGEMWFKDLKKIPVFEERPALPTACPVQMCDTNASRTSRAHPVPGEKNSNQHKALNQNDLYDDPPEIPTICSYSSS